MNFLPNEPVPPVIITIFPSISITFISPLAMYWP
jgi:hypothetical protein